MSHPGESLFKYTIEELDRQLLARGLFFRGPRCIQRQQRFALFDGDTNTKKELTSS
jgi:hypothetical protein